MRLSEVSKRWAHSFFEMAQAKNSPGVFLMELEAAQLIFSENQEISEFFMSPTVTKNQKEKLLQKTVRSKGFSEETENFLCLLAQKGRLNFLGEIVSSFKEAYDRSQGYYGAQVRTPHELDRSDMEKIKSSTESIFDRKISLHQKVDPSLLGGLTLEALGFRFNNSLNFHLKRLKEKIQNRRI